MPHSTGTAARYEAEALGRRNHADLVKLRYDWGDAYDIRVDYPRSWSARRLDNEALLMADCAAVLRALILENYSASPVPRQVLGGTRDAEQATGRPAG